MVRAWVVIRSTLVYAYDSKQCFSTVLKHTASCPHFRLRFFVTSNTEFPINPQNSLGHHRHPFTQRFSVTALVLEIQRPQFERWGWQRCLALSLHTLLCGRHKNEASTPTVAPPCPTSLKVSKEGEGRGWWCWLHFIFHGHWG